MKESMYTGKEVCHGCQKYGTNSPRIYMKKIDNVWLRRILYRHDKFSRSIPLNSKSMRCTQSIFIDRYFSFLQNKTYKLKIKGDVYWAMFTKNKVIRERLSGGAEINFNYGIRKHLGYSTESGGAEINFNYGIRKHLGYSTESGGAEINFNYGIRKHLGYSTEFCVCFLCEKGNMIGIDGIHFNDLCDIEYEEVDNKKFYEVMQLFI